MKAIDEDCLNGEIKIYSQTPKSWGNVIGGFHLLSDEQLESYGFYDVVTPEHNQSVEELSEIYFDSDNDVFTYNVNDKTWSETVAELKAIRIKELNNKAHNLLSITDWEIIRKADTGDEVSPNTQENRNEIRDNVVIIEAEINSKTTKKSVMSYEFEL